MMKIQRVINELERLAAKASEQDKIHGENHTNLFDKKLFSCQSKHLLPCVKEAQNNLTSLLDKQKKGELDHQRTTHLCEKLFNQISALKRELNTAQLRKREKQYIPKPSNTIHHLYQELAKHQGWERQLSANVKIVEAELQWCLNFIQQQQKQQRLLAAEKRLAKCTEARIKIERHIARLEHKN